MTFMLHEIKFFTIFFNCLSLSATISLNYSYERNSISTIQNKIYERININPYFDLMKNKMKYIIGANDLIC